MLDDINTILAPSVFGYDKKLLIGFPNGSKDLATLFENLQENWIKEVLNGGKSVSELVRVFGPMTKFESQLSSLEQIWIKSDRETYANTTRKGLISLKIINKANPVDVSDSLAKVNTTFVNLGSIADVNSTVLDEFNQLLNSSEPFTSFKKQLAGFLDAPEVAQFSLTELNIFKVDYDKLKKDEDKLDMLKKNLSISKYSQNLEFFQNQLELLVSAKNATKGYFKRLVEFNSSITDTNVSYFRRLIENPQNVKSEITAVENFVKMLNSLPSFSEKEREMIERIADFLVLVKSKMSESKLLEENLKLEIKKTGGLNRLSGFPSARNLTSQLAYTERTLHFFQKKDLKQDFQNLATNGEKLMEFIENLPAKEKQQVGSGWSNISSLNKSLSSLLPVIKSLPSNSTLPESNLTSFGKSLFFLDAMKIPEFNFSSMVSAINYLKSSRVGQSENVLKAEQSLIKLEGLQYASMRQNGTLGTLLGQADGFFTTFFSETSEWSIVWIISGVLVAVVAGPLLWWLCFYKKFSSLREKSISPSLSQISISEESVEQNTVGNGTDDEAAGQSENGEDQTLEEPEVKYPEAAVRAEKNSRDALKEKLSLENGLPPKHRDGRNSKENEEAIAKVRAYVKETIEQQRSDAMSGEFPIDLPSESSTDALKGPSNLENGFPPKDRDGRNSKENEEAIAKVRAYVKETIEQQRSDAMSSSEMQTYLPSESSIEPTPPLPENVILDRIWYDPTQNEMYDIETGGDSMEMETSMSFAILKTEDQTVKKHSADKKVDDSSTTTTSMEKRTVEG